MAHLFLSFLEISVSVSLIAAVLILFTPFLNKRYALKWKYWVWIFLAVRLMIPFSGTDAKAVSDALLLRKVPSELEYEIRDGDNLQEQTVLFRRIVVEIPAQVTDPILMQSSESDIKITLLGLAVFIWVLGSLLFLSVHFISYFCYKNQLIKKGTRVKDVCVLDQVTKLRWELDIHGTVDVVESSEAVSPMIIGFIKPILILPKEQYSEEQLFFILKHELVHLKRKDVYIKLLLVVANAIHWFNPIIWIMQREAVIDMELSCDERVTQGTGYAVKKAYAETLLSTLQMQCEKRSALLTHFYGGKRIMKKRFKNILKKNGRKYGISILVCVVVLTVCIGTRVGYSIAGENSDDVWNPSEMESTLSDLDGMSDILENTTKLMLEKELDEEDKIMLSFSKEGEVEQKQAILMAGNGYSVYLPDGEWQIDKEDGWHAVVNQDVRIWAKHLENESAIKQALSGYELVEEEMVKQEDGLVYKVIQHEVDNGVWGVFYCYPPEAEEGWGREIPVIADTFAVTIP